MITPPRSSAAFLSGARLASAEMEDAYRRHHLHDDARNAGLMFAVFGLLFIAFVPSDVRLFGNSRTFFLLLALRIACLGTMLASIALLRRIREPRQLDVVVLFASLLTSLATMLIASTRPRGYVLHTVIDVMMLNAVWTILPNRFAWQALATAAFTLQEALVLTFFRDPMPAIGTFAVATAFAAANAFGAVVAWRFHRTRRRAYVALMSEEEGRRALVAAHGEAQAANRAKNVFLASVSHEILTPLNAVLGFADVLLRRRNDPEDREALEAIQASGRSLHGLLSDVLDLARGEAAEVALAPAHTDITLLLADVQLMMMPRCEEKGLWLRVEVAGTPPPVVLDGGRLRQVLLNLVGNAVRFTHTGGVTISCAVATGAPDQFDVAIAVADTGGGIAAAEQEAVFEPFHQGEGIDRARLGGAGLGLAVCRRLAERMGGRLVLESAAGRGTTFRLELHGVEAAPPEPEKVARADLRLPPATVLIVDDEPWNRALLRAYLRDQPVRVEEAASVDEAIAALLRERPDAVLVDMRMPGKTGDELLAWARARSDLAGLPLVAVTAHTDDPRDHVSDFDGRLAKPVSRQVLLETLARMLPQAPHDPERPRASTPGLAAMPPLGTALAPLLESASVLVKIPHAGSARELAERAVSLATRHDVPSLARWAEELCSRADALDAAGLCDTLDRLPALAARIASGQPHE